MARRRRLVFQLSVKRLTKQSKYPQRENSLWVQSMATQDVAAKGNGVDGLGDDLWGC